MVLKALDNPDPACRIDAGDWFTPGRFAVLLLLLICAAYPDVVFGGNSFCFRDFSSFGYPLAFYHRERFWSGEIPLWNPLNNCGMPFLAQWNTLTLYPGSLIYLLLPVSWSLSAFCVAHLYLAGLAMYWLALNWTGNRLAAAVAGLGFAFNGLSLNSLMWPNNIAALGWMPLVVLFVERAWREGGTIIIWASLFGALQMLSGAPEICLFTWVILGLIAMSQVALKTAPLPRIVGRFSLIVLCVGGLCAAQLLPFLDLLRHSQRSTGYGTSEWSMPLTGWANLLVPLLRTLPVKQGVAFQWDQYWTSSYYLGIGMLTFGILAVWQVRQRRVWFLGFIALVGLILALGDNGFLFQWIKSVIPLGFMRFPIKFVVLTIFAAPLLGAYGVRHYVATLPKNSESRWRRLVLLLVLLLLAIVGISWFGFHHPIQGEDPNTTLKNAASRAVFLVLIAIAFWSSGHLKRKESRWVSQLGLLVLLAFDVLTHAPRQNPTIPRAALELSLTPLKELHPLPRHGESRAAVTIEAAEKLHFTITTNLVNDYIIHSLCLYADCNLPQGIPKLGGFYSLDLPLAARMTAMSFTNTDNSMSGLNDFLGVSQISMPGVIGEWTNRTGFLPMITAGQRPVFADDATTLQMLGRSDFNPRQVVYLPLEAGQKIGITNTSEIKIEQAEVLAQSATVRVQARQAGLVVISQAFYHPWTAYVDGHRESIWRANYAYQAVQVPVGEHIVRLVYEDQQFRLGVIISGLTLAMVGSFLVIGRLRHRA